MKKFVTGNFPQRQNEETKLLVIYSWKFSIFKYRYLKIRKNLKYFHINVFHIISKYIFKKWKKSENGLSRLVIFSMIFKFSDIL